LFTLFGSPNCFTSPRKSSAEAGNVRKHQAGCISFYGQVSLTPGFSPVTADGTGPGRFNGLAGAAAFKREQTVETVFLPRPALSTRLKPGVNEISEDHRFARKRDATGLGAT
jgi:hypothetical protein